MIPTRQLPIPDAPPPASWTAFKTRLENWVLSVSQSFQQQVLKQQAVTELTPTPVGLTWAGTVPFNIDVDTDGIPRAELVVDGVVQFFNPGTLAAGQWNIQQVPVTNPVTSQPETVTVIALFAAPATAAWFAFLVAR